MWKGNPSAIGWSKQIMLRLNDTTEAKITVRKTEEKGIKTMKPSTTYDSKHISPLFFAVFKQEPLLNTPPKEYLFN